MPVTMLLDSGQTYSGRAYRDCIASADTHNVPIIIARREMQWRSGDVVVLNVLAPSLPFLADTGDDVNENSIVVLLHAGTFRELFMGDAGEASESRLLATDASCPEQRRGVAEDMVAGERRMLEMTACDDDLHAEVGKIGHHGSRYASTAAFVAAVRPLSDAHAVDPEEAFIASVASCHMLFFLITPPRVDLWSMPMTTRRPVHRKLRESTIKVIAT